MRLWFNRGLATVYDSLRSIRAAADPRLTLLASTTGVPNALSTVVDDLFPEPVAGTSDADYIRWAVATCREKGVDLFMPSRRREAIARQVAAFAPTQVALPGPADVLDLLEAKDRFYDRLVDLGLPVAAYRRFRTLAEFDEARAAFDRPICVKPVRGVFAAGFYRLTDSTDEYGRLLNGSNYSVGIDPFRRILATADRPRPYLLLEYLPGIERSVDCLAHQGRLVVGICRTKHGNSQHIATEGPSVDLARALVEVFGLTGIVNVQTREDAVGVPRVLEVNARASGGLPFAELAGVSLNYWAALLALGLAKPADVPLPRSGMVVAPVTAAVVLTP